MYPNDLRPGTGVCHFFTKQWSAMGYDVKVIYLRSMFPKIYTDLARLFPKLALKYVGNHVEMDRNMSIQVEDKEGIPVYSIPIYKYVPHGKYPKRSIDRCIGSILDIIQEQGFVPDAIVGHFYNPTTELIYELKKTYPEAKTSIVFHEAPYDMKRIYKKNARVILDSFDILGFRHKTMREWYEKAFGQFRNTFICYSGTKDVFLNTPFPTKKDFTDGNMNEFLFVGQFTYNKCVQETIEAIHNCYPNGDFHLTCVGSGGTAYEDINKDILNYGIQNNVTFTGQITRDEIIKYYDRCQVFILISRSEAFGLVYLEAMSRGCICIGTRGQGIDGVIIDGENGFLCGGGDAKELASIINHIKSLTVEEKRTLSDKAIATAKDLSDYNVAKRYIDSVMNS